MSEQTEKSPEKSPEQIQADAALQELKINAISIGMRMGTDFHPNIGAEKLQLKIEQYQERLASEYAAKNAPKRPLPKHLPITADEANESNNARRERKMKDANRYVRAIVTCMNPDKALWDGEFLSASNSLIGTVRKFIPFNRDEPYHIPRILLDMLKERKFTHFQLVRGKHGVDSKKGRLAPEFNIQEFDDLTLAEHKELQRQQQLRKASID